MPSLRKKKSDGNVQRRYLMTFCVITNNQATHMPTSKHHLINASMVGASKPSLCYLLTGARSLPTAPSKQQIQHKFGINPPSPCLMIPPPRFTRHQASIAQSVIVLQNFNGFTSQNLWLAHQGETIGE